ncbi:MAG: methyltransferase domain-containing protein [Fimbriimonadaceae bacterium]|nr:methyltransferase domain-containing protein [Fimbriimonadaceae bacterium]
MSRGPLRRTWKRVREACLEQLGCLYTARFYAKSDRHKGASDDLVAASLIAHFAPRRVIDLGCGNGTFLRPFVTAGCECLGLERSAAGLAACAARGVPAVRCDLRHDPLPAAAHGDLALCFEVAEHLPAQWAPRLVELVTAAAPRVVFTAAPPGQGGVRHVNERPPAYWIDLFATRGWRHLAAPTAQLRAEWQAAGVVAWLVSNLLLFEEDR